MKITMMAQENFLADFNTLKKNFMLTDSINYKTNLDSLSICHGGELTNTQFPTNAQSRIH